MKTIAQYIESLPSPLRHALIALLVLELGVVANGFAGVASWQDITAAAVALPVVMVIAAARFVLQQLAAAP